MVPAPYAPLVVFVDLRSTYAIFGHSALECPLANPSISLVALSAGRGVWRSAEMAICMALDW